MILSTEDKDLFFRLNWSLLFYVNKKYPVINGINTPDFKNQDLNNDSIKKSLSCLLQNLQK